MLAMNQELQCGVFDSRISRGAKLKSQSRQVKYYELELFHCVGGTSYVNSAAYPIRRGMLLCAKPGDVRHSDFPARCSFIRVECGKDADIDRLLSAAPTCIYLEDETEIERLLGIYTKLSNVLIGVSSDLRELHAVKANLYFLDILCRTTALWHGEEGSEARRPLSRVASEAYEYINENYCGNCTLAKIAAALHISPNYLHAVFLREIGKTPFAYVVEKRIERAKRLIVAGEMTMVEIALEIGFCSQSHFNKVFKEITGETPAAYRRGVLARY